MDCTEPGRIADDDLFALACGELRPAAASHVATCAACASTVSEYATADRRLAGSLYRLDCPPALRLGELALNMLEPRDTFAVRAHLADCPRCGAEFSDIVEAARGEPLAELMRAPGVLRRIVANLMPVPVRGLAMAGLRGSTGGTRVYEAEDVTVSLIEQASEQGGIRVWSVLGLVDLTSPTSFQASEAVLNLDANRVALAKVDQLGNFALDYLQSGIYSLELQFQDRVVVLDGVIVGDTDN
jgi:hypothetical protein